MFKRRIFLINPKFQLSFIGWMIGISLTLNSIFYASNLYFFKLYIKQGEHIGLSKDHVFFNFINDQFKRMNSIFLITSILAFALIVIVGFIISHRVAGPLYRLCMHLEATAKGAPPKKIKFRA